MHGNTVFVGVCVILLHLPFYNFLSWCGPYRLNIKDNINKVGWRVVDTDWLEISRADAKYIIDLKLQVHMNNSLREKSEKNGPEIIKIYRIYNCAT